MACYSAPTGVIVHSPRGSFRSSLTISDETRATPESSSHLSKQLGTDATEDPGDLIDSGVEYESIDDSAAPVNSSDFLLPIQEYRSWPLQQDVVPAVSKTNEMAAINAPRLVVTAERPTTTGSWDDLINRNRGRSRNSAYSQLLLSENEERRRAQAENRVHNSIGETGSARGGMNGGSQGQDQGQQGPAARPRRMAVHHPHQRTSQAFAAHVSHLNGRPSPLSTSTSSDAFPEFDPGAGRTLDINAGGDQLLLLDDSTSNAFPSRPSMYARSQRMSDGPRVVDPSFTFSPRPSSYQSSPETSTLGSGPGPRNRMRTVSWNGMPPSREDLEFQTYSDRGGSPNRYSTAGYRRPELIKHFRIQRSAPNEIFNKLPAEVLRLILDHLKNLHLQRQGNGCATCWMRNCCAVSLCNRKMLPIARAALYEHIQLIGGDSPAQRKKYKNNIYSTRLVLLRRSLRGDHKLAELVRTIKVPALAEDATIEARQYHDIVASVVMACPNLERLDGFYPTYDHGHSRLFNALGSRAALKEMTWVIDAPPLEQESTEVARRSQSRTRRSVSRSRTSKSRGRSTSVATHAGRHINSRGYLIPELANKFVLQHSYWKELTNLTIHCLPGANLSTPNDLIAVVTTYLPSLKALCLSHVSSRSFDDDTLLAISRPLTKLSLAHCPGVTTSGLAAFAAGSVASDLETLTLIHQDLDSLAAVVRILSKLNKLVTLNVVQALAPKLQDDTLVWLMPYLASPSLKTLHWDIFESSTPSSMDPARVEGTEADDILARSIMANGFPSLRKLRVPQDPGGMFQALCRPNERIDLPGDRYLNLLVGQAGSNSNSTGPRPTLNFGRNSSRPPRGTKQRASTMHSYSASGVTDIVTISDTGITTTSDGRSSSETGDSGKSFLPTRDAGSDLHQARLQAQARLEAARRFPRFEINVTDCESGQLVESSGLAGYLGDVTSKIHYCLSPERGASDERGGLVGMFEVLGDGGEELVNGDKGDLAFRSGAGYGTGCVARAYERAQALLVGERAAAAAALKSSSGISSSTSKLVKGGGGGGKKEKAAAAASQGVVDSIEMNSKRKEGCTGRTVGGGNDGEKKSKKEKERNKDVNWHVERGRWRGRVEVA